VAVVLEGRTVNAATAFLMRRESPVEGDVMTKRVRSIAGLGAGVAAVMIAGGLAWVMWPTLSDADDRPASLQPAAIQPAEEAGAPTPAMAPADAPDAAQAPASAEAPAAWPLDGLRISSQSWRRGGLGSKALITFTLRNANSYAVKDIEIACAFARRDGSHLTDRKRVIGEAVEMKSRKTFTRLHVGFVNVNADKAKCALVAASRV
jgi:hypothetical protein